MLADVGRFRKPKMKPFTRFTATASALHPTVACGLPFHGAGWREWCVAGCRDGGCLCAVNSAGAPGASIAIRNKTGPGFLQRHSAAETTST